MRRVLNMLAAAALSGALFSSCAFGNDDAVKSLFQNEEEPLVVAVGTNEFGWYAAYSSLNGSIWTANLAQSFWAGQLYCAAYGNGVIFAAGSNPLLFLTRDGILWGSLNTGSSINCYGATYGENRFIGVGFNSGPGRGIIYASLDGVIWSGNLLANPPFFALNDVAYGDGRFVAVGMNYNIYMSPDGLVWSGNVGFSTAPIYDFNGVTYGNGKFVVVGGGTSIAVSEDGLAWSLVLQDQGLPVALQAVAYGAGRFVAVGTSGLGNILVSNDGIAWSNNIYSGTFTDFQDVTYCNGKFIAVGTGSAVSISSDGLIWEDRSMPGSVSLYGVICRP